MKKLIMVMAVLVILTGCATVRTDFAPLRFDTMVAKSGSDILLTTGTIDRPYKRDWRYLCQRAPRRIPENYGSAQGKSPGGGSRCCHQDRIWQQIILLPSSFLPRSGGKL